MDNDNCWCDELSSVSVGSDHDSEFRFHLKILSFNVLAESYLTEKSHPGLPEQYASVAFDQKKRRKLLLETLQSLTGDASDRNTRDSTLGNVSYDVLCFQELDLFDLCASLLEKEFDFCYSKVSARSDRCAIFWRRSLYELVESQVVEFDDLAQPVGESNNNNNNYNNNSNNNNNNNNNNSNNVENNSAFDEGGNYRDGNDGGDDNHDNSEQNMKAVGDNTRRRKKKKTKNHNQRQRTKTSTATSGLVGVSGMASSFLRRNTASIAVLRHKKNKRKFAISSAHLYWNPGYEYVKLGQTKLLLDRLQQLAVKHSDNDDSIDKEFSSLSLQCSSLQSHISNNEYIRDKKENTRKDIMPVFVCGDFNSKPGSSVHTYITKGRIDARIVAPWRTTKTLNSTISSHDASYNNGDYHEDDSHEEDSLNKSRASGYTSGNQERNSIIEENQELREKLRNISRSIQRQKRRKQQQQKQQEQQLLMDGTISTSSAPLSLDKTTNSHPITIVQPIKYMLDYTLNRLTRWFRILGLDAALETQEEEKERTRKGGKKIHIFDHCRKEGRVLITTSVTLLQRRDCPPGTYLVNPYYNLEQTFCHILLLHGIVLQPSNFISKCVVCNGFIVNVEAYPEIRKELLEANSVPESLLQNMTVYGCDFCLQSYWWSDNPNSSASRVKNAAVHLFVTTLRAGIPWEGELGRFHHVDVQSERDKGREGIVFGNSNNKNNNNNKKKSRANKEEEKNLDSDTTKTTTTDSNSKTQTNIFPRVMALEWLNNPDLKHPFGCLQSAYYCGVNDDTTASKGSHKDENEKNGNGSLSFNELLPFTNVTLDFVDTLDYIFYEPQKCVLLERLGVPTTFSQMNSIGQPNGHLIPSDRWPSDHLAIGATFGIQ